MDTESVRKAHDFPHINYEKALWLGGVLHVAGLDEAGRGCWAGPLYAASVILPPEEAIVERLHGVRDSKQMTSRQRSYWAEQIKINALAWGVGTASNQEVDRMGVVAATRLAMQRALGKLNPPPQHLLLDYLLLPEVDLPQTSLVRGDSQSLCIAAASVLAKTARDARLFAMDKKYPGYGFAQHKGYGTTRHRQALHDLGVSPIHRLSFKPVQGL